MDSSASTPIPQQALHRIRMSQLPLKSTETSVIGGLHLTEQPVKSVSLQDTEDSVSKQGVILHVRYTIVREFLRLLRDRLGSFELFPLISCPRIPEVHPKTGPCTDGIWCSYA